MAQTELPELSADALLITGATGFVGGAFVRRLLRSGAAAGSLRCLVRDPKRAAVALPGVSLCHGDLGDAGGAPSLLAAAAGVRTVVHLAGTLTGVRSADFDEVNAAGTARLVAAVEAAAPAAHFVLLSSLAAAGPSCDGVASSLPPDRAQPVSFYGHSKRRGELAVVQSRLRWTIVRPPVVYGEGDAATRLLFRQACAPVTAVPKRARPLSVIHVDDVVAALLAVLRVRPHGAILPLDGIERTDTHALLRAIAQACGRRSRLLSVPMFVASAAALVCDLVARLRGKAGFFNRDKVREIAASGWVADGGPAFASVRFTPLVSLAEGLAAVARAEGFLTSEPGAR